MEPHHRHDRPEGLLGHQLHRVVHVHDHGRPDPAPAAAVDLDPPATEDFRAAAQRVVDLPRDDVGLAIENQRTDDTRVHVRVIDRHRARLLDQPRDETIVERILHVDTLERLAGLPVASTDARSTTSVASSRSAVRCDDHRVLAAELEERRNEMLRGRAPDRATRLDAAREADDIHETDQCGTGATVTHDNVAHGRKLGHCGDARLQRLDEPRRHFARLHEHGTTGEQRRNGVDERQRQRKIPWTDHADERVRHELRPERDGRLRLRAALFFPHQLRRLGAPAVDCRRRCRRIRPVQAGDARCRSPVPRRSRPRCASSWSCHRCSTSTRDSTGRVTQSNCALRNSAARRCNASGWRRHDFVVELAVAGIREPGCCPWGGRRWAEGVGERRVSGLVAYRRLFSNASMIGWSASRMSSASSPSRGTHLSAWPSRPHGSPLQSVTTHMSSQTIRSAYRCE